MDKETAFKIIDSARDLTDSPNSFIRCILRGCETYYPELAQELMQKFDETFDKLYWKQK